jgi:hypothetical protein
MSGRRDNRLAARIDIEHLRFAVAAADFGSFYKAAEALNVHQSTLSRRIQLANQPHRVTVNASRLAPHLFFAAMTGLQTGELRFRKGANAGGYEPPCAT